MEKVNKIRCLATATFATILIASLIPSMILTASSRVITVPDDYPSIQEAINAAQAGETVFVRSGQYNETIIIDKSLNLVGEDKETTIIDGNSAQRIVLVNADYVNITGFTIQNTAKGDIKSVFELNKGETIGAISLKKSTGCVIKNNTILNVNAGVHISTGSNNTIISDNKIVSNIGCGVLIYDQVMLTTPTSPISGTVISNNSMEVGGGLFPTGVSIVGASSNVITANNISASCGIYLIGKNANLAWAPGGQSNVLVPHPSDYNIVSNNSISGEQYGFYMEKSNNNIVSDNNFTSLYLKECSNTTLRNNALSNFGLEGSEFLHFLNDIDVSNTVEGKPIYYLTNQSNLLITPFTYPNIGYLGIVNSRNITLGRLSFGNKMQGLMLAQTTNCEISEMSLANCQVGIYLWNCCKIDIIGSAISECPTGLEMRLSRNSTIRGNNFLHSALILVNSSDNTFHRNNFIGSPYIGVQIQMIDSVNTWDDGDSRPGPFDCPICVDKRLVGNYWSDYQGQDNGSHTQSHNCPGDGVGDTELPVHGVDYYPLMKPWTPLVGDLDYNGIVNIVDLYRAAKNYGKTSP